MSIDKHENTRLEFPIPRPFIRLQMLSISLRSLVARRSVERNRNTRASMKYFRVRYSSNVLPFFSSIIMTNRVEQCESRLESTSR